MGTLPVPEATGGQEVRLDQKREDGMRLTPETFPSFFLKAVGTPQLALSELKLGQAS